MTTPATVNMLTVTYTDGPASNTRSHKRMDSHDTTPTPHPDVLPKIFPEATPTTKPLTADRLEALLQMQRTDPFCKHISKCLLNGKALQHERYFYSCKRITMQAHHGLWKTVSCPHYPKILEVHSLGRSL